MKIWKKHVLNHGEVELVGLNLNLADLQPENGNLDLETLTLDPMIERAARISYGGKTRKKRDTQGLIDYLLRHEHTSPFEQVSFTFKIKAPLFVVQQLLRHRTAKLNQESGRYSVLSNRYFKPGLYREQSQYNKQGSQEGDKIVQSVVEDIYVESVEGAYESYQGLLNAGVAREQARGVLPTSTYTTLVWQMDLHNLLHFLKLRMNDHAQFEIQEYARAIFVMISDWVPNTIDSWLNHVYHRVSLSFDELFVLRRAIESQGIDFDKAVAEAGKNLGEMLESPSREREFRAKFT